MSCFGNGFSKTLRGLSTRPDQTDWLSKWFAATLTEVAMLVDPEPKTLSTHRLISDGGYTFAGSYPTGLSAFRADLLVLADLLHLP